MVSARPGGGLEEEAFIEILKSRLGGFPVYHRWSEEENLVERGKREGGGRERERPLRV